jgi:type I restriction enzyme S subunit
VSLPRYIEHKESGVEWAETIPAGWAVRPLIGVAAEREESNLGMIENNLLSLSYGRIVEKDIAANDGLLPESFETYQVVRPGDIVLRLTDLQNDKRSLRSAIVNRVGIITSAYVAVAPFDIEPEFLNHLFRAYDVRKVFYSMGGGLRQSMKFSDLKRLPIIVPTPAEQSAIVTFLNRETSKLDALVAEQEQLIALLQEKRHAVISRAVTKGLNPGAPMGASGIEWLDEVPKHWRAVQVKHLAADGRDTFTDGDWIEAPYIVSEGVRLLQTGNVGIGYFKEQGFRYVSEETFEALKCTEVKPRDVLICRLDGPVGRACLAPDLGMRMITSVDNAILKCGPDVVPEYVVAVFSSVPWLSWIDALCRVGGGFRLRVSRRQLGELRVPLPPRDEQLRIVDHLASVLSGFDNLAAEARYAIGLLLERRSALISAAVTGQIDVRNLAVAHAA